MKKLVSIFFLIIVCLNLQASFGRLDFVATNQGLYYFKTVRHGFSTFLIGVEKNGDVTKFSKNEIIAYTKNGKHFEKMPLYNQNNTYLGEAFMELVKIENGLKVYKYSSLNDKEKNQFQYLIFRDKTYKGYIRNPKNISRFY